MALLIVEISTLFLLLVSLLMVVLIGRRWLDERRASVRATKRREVTKLYLASLQDAGAPAVPDNISLQLQREAVSHLLQLLRGAEREKLLASAEKNGLFDSAVATASSKLAAKRAEAVQMLEQFGSHQCQQALLVLMANDRKEAVRLAAAAALARLGALPSARDTISLLHLEDQKLLPLHRVLFRSLATSHPEQLRELLSTALSNSLRIAILDALSAQQDMEDLSVLQVAVADSDPEVRAEAIRAVGKLGDYQVAAWVIEALEDEEELVRVQAAQAAGALGLRNALPKLELMLDDPSPWVRMGAEDALNRLDPRRAARAA